jgi:REP element-mobilizing transposase RayT
MVEELMDKGPDQHRKNIRLENYDTTSPGYYFVTIVSHERKNIFGEIIDGEMNLNQAGKIVEQTWQEIPRHFPNTSCEIFVVMPNHIHGIINIIDDEMVGARHKVSRNEDSAEPLQQIKTQPLGVIVRSFKSAVTKRAHDLELFIGEKIWQRNYYEHIIRDEADYQQIVDYIASNPINWEYDLENLKTSNPIQKSFYNNHADQTARN